MFRKGFQLDGIEEVFFGYTDGSLWNGFENPWFDKNTTIRILNAIKREEGYSWEYDQQNNSFRIFFEEYDGLEASDNKVEEWVEDLVPHDIDDKILYCWGWGWCWYEVREKTMKVM